MTFLSSAQATDLLDGDAPRAQLVEGVAGGGKSTALTAIARDCARAGRKVLLLTFSESGKAVLQRYAAAAGLAPKQTDVFTFDTLARWIMSRLETAQPADMPADRIIRDILPGVIDAANAEIWQQDGQPLLTHQEARRQLWDDLQYIKHAGAVFEEDAELQEGMLDGMIHGPLAGTLIALRHYERQRERHFIPPADQPGFRGPGDALFDFVRDYRDDLLAGHWPEALPGYRFILVDEFHDTTPLQMQFLAMIARHAIRIVAVGDRYQTLYGWKGADAAHVFARYAEAFAPVRRRNLPESHRFGPALADAVNRFLGKRDFCRSAAAHETRILHHTGNLCDLADAASEGDTAIVCRDHGKVLEATLALLPLAGRFDIDYHAILTGAWSTRILTGLCLLSPPPAARDSRPFAPLPLPWLADCLRSLLGLPGFNLSARLVDTLAADIAAGRFNVLPHIDLLLAPDSRAERANPALPVVAPDLARALRGFIASDPAAPLAPRLDAFARAARLPAMLAALSEEAETREALVSGWSALLHYLAQDALGTRALVALLAGPGRHEGRKPRLAVIDVFEAKGHQWDTVIVHGLDEGAFPKHRTTFDNDTHRFYVAVTRARKTLILHADARPGRFHRTFGTRTSAP